MNNDWQPVSMLLTPLIDKEIESNLKEIESNLFARRYHMVMSVWVPTVRSTWFAVRSTTMFRMKIMQDHVKGQ